MREREGEREGERERDRETERQRQRERESYIIESFMTNVISLFKLPLFYFCPLYFVFKGGGGGRGESGTQPTSDEIKARLKVRQPREPVWPSGKALGW